MLRLILIGVILLPIIEIVLFVQIGGVIGVWPVLALVMLAAAVGVWLLRGGSGRSPFLIRQALEEGRDPGPEIFRSASRFFAALLLILPGFFSDLVAVLLLLPPVQHLLYQRISRGFDGSVTAWGDMHGDMDRRELKDITPQDTGDGPRAPSGWTRHDGG